MNKDQVKGRLDQAAGKVKEAAGKAVGNERLEGEGLADQADGKVQSTLGDARQGVKDAVQKVADKI
ncbi:MAG: CsbD family protein [Comamonadaceae bacterium]|nr:MAG: CsbD family protein [Comamonadaceae bacterium]